MQSTPTAVPVIVSVQILPDPEAPYTPHPDHDLLVECYQLAARLEVEGRPPTKAELDILQTARHAIRRLLTLPAT